jgi:hypothetical protein
MHGNGGDGGGLKDPGPTGITLTEWRLSELEKLVKDRSEDFAHRIDQNEARITKLETWRTFVLGAASAVSLALGLFAKQAIDYLSGGHH